MSQRGEALSQAGRAAEAEEVFRDLLARLEASAAYDAAYDYAYTLWNLGRCLRVQGQHMQAIEWHQQALAEFERLSESNKNAKAMLGVVYSSLADSLATAGQFDEAQQAYDNSLNISKEVDNRRQIAVALCNLGNLAETRGDLGEAQHRLTEAMEVFRNLCEPPSAEAAEAERGRRGKAQ